MKPSEICKREGLKLNEVSEITGQSDQTLINWASSPNKSRLFKCVVVGAAKMKQIQREEVVINGVEYVPKRS